jgi:hypothetical protein
MPTIAVHECAQTETKDATSIIEKLKQIASLK